MPFLGRTLSLDHSTSPALDPLELTAAAITAECDAISLRIGPFPKFPDPKWDFVRDEGYRQRLKNAVGHGGLAVRLGSGFVIDDNTQIATYADALDAFADLGAGHLSVAIFDQDEARRVDSFGGLVEMAKKCGITVLIEYFALASINNLESALGLIDQIGTDGAGISADLLHVTRTGSDLEHLNTLPPGMIGYAQVCDGPLSVESDHAWEEATAQRQLPGEGVFDVSGFIQAIPPEVPLGIEAPDLGRIRAGVSMHQHALDAVAALRNSVAKAIGG